MRRAAHLIAFFLLLLAGSLSAPAEAREDLPAEKSSVYRPDVHYGGIFERDRLYRLYSENSNWRGSSAPALLEDVHCPPARTALQQSGRWTGNLHRDGSCGGEAEPGQWVSGNYLNYLAEE